MSLSIAAKRIYPVGDDLVACVVPFVEADRPLAAEEELLLDGKTGPRRRIELVAGRQAAHLAIEALGPSVLAVAQGSGGEPVFPLHLRGSIAHTSDCAVAVVGLAETYESVGVDLEDGRSLGPVPATGVTWRSEVAQVQSALGLPDADLAQNFVFSAKEAVFKCQYPITGSADVSPLQARLIPVRQSASQLLVKGWRVRGQVRKALAAVVVERHLLGNVVIALAIHPRVNPLVV